MTEAGQAPWRRTVRRLLSNRLAAVGGLLVIVMMTLVALGPMLLSQDPFLQRAWLGAQAPGFRHPLCNSENRFRLQAEPVGPAAFATASKLELTVQEQEVEAYRARLRRGKVRDIVRVRGAQHADSLTLGGEGSQAVETREDGTARVLPAVTLVVGERPPDGVFLDSSRLVEFDLGQPAVDRSYQITLAHGLVTEMQRDGQAVENLILLGDAIREVRIDGEIREVSHLLGTDEKGRDLLARVLFGGRVSIMVGVVATAVSLLIGVCYGAIAGYFGGRVDRVMMSIVDILYAVPFMFIVILLMVIFSRSLIMLFIALGAVQWLTMSRIVRGQILTLKEMDFVTAARIGGAKTPSIIFQHLLPNAMGPVIVYATLTVPAVILEESFLSFIGLSVQYNNQALDSWGALVKQGIDAFGTDGSNLWLLLVPSLAMATTLLGLNALGDGLRDCFDPRHNRSDA